MHHTPYTYTKELCNLFSLDKTYLIFTQFCVAKVPSKTNMLTWAKIDVNS